jgi:hypothetical protein
MITGAIGGKNILGAFHVTGTPPRAGNFLLQVQSDPKYGKYVAMVPAPGPGLAAPIEFGKNGTLLMFKDGTLLMQKDGLPANPMLKFDLPANVMDKKPGDPRWAAGDLMQKDGLPANLMQSAVYIVSDKPIAGRNCIVMTRGFSDLVSALTSSGVAMIHIDF